MLPLRDGAPRAYAVRESPRRNEFCTASSLESSFANRASLRPAGSRSPSTATWRKLSVRQTSQLRANPRSRARTGNARRSPTSRSRSRIRAHRSGRRRSSRSMPEPMPKTRQSSNWKRPSLVGGPGPGTQTCTTRQQLRSGERRRQQQEQQTRTTRMTMKWTRRKTTTRLVSSD